MSESTVILVCDLVHGSVAQQDGRLKKADQLVCIGDVNVIGQPVSVVVDILKATRSGPVVLKIRHALRCSLLEEEEVRVTHPQMLISASSNGVYIVGLICMCVSSMQVLL